MLEYERISVSEGIDANKSHKSKECDICHYWYRKSWKEFDELKNIDQKYYCSNYYDVSSNKYGVKCGPSLRFLENKGWINP